MTQIEQLQWVGFIKQAVRPLAAGAAGLGGPIGPAVVTAMDERSKPSDLWRAGGRTALEGTGGGVLGALAGLLFPPAMPATTAVGAALGGMHGGAAAARNFNKRQEQPKKKDEKKKAEPKKK